MTLREDPPTPPHCPFCGSIECRFDENGVELSGRGWKCETCLRVFTGTAHEAAQIAADRARQAKNLDAESSTRSTGRRAVSNRTFPSSAFAAALGQDTYASPTRWAPFFGKPDVGSGYRRWWTEAEVIAARALRGWSARGSWSPRSEAVVRAVCTGGVKLIEGGIRYGVVVDGRIYSAETAEEIVQASAADFAYTALTIHVIDFAAARAACIDEGILTPELVS